MLSACTLLASCSQSYTDGAGETSTTPVPKAVVNVDETKSTLKSQTMTIGMVPPKYHGSMQIGAVTGFGKNKAFTVQQAPISDKQARAYFADSLKEAGALPGGKYVLDIALLKPAVPPSLGAVRAETEISYTLKNRAGQTVFSTIETAPFLVTFKAVPLGNLRGMAAFTGSLNNNTALFVRALK